MGDYRKVLSTIDPSKSNVDQVIECHEFNMRIVICFGPITVPDSRLFHRGASMVHFGITLPSNYGEWLFSRMLRTSITAKIRKRQAHTVAGAKTALVVDCSSLPSFLYEHEPNGINRLVAAHNLRGLVDVIAFCKRDGNSSVTFLWTKSNDEGSDVVKQLFT